MQRLPLERKVKTEATITDGSLVHRGTKVEIHFPIQRQWQRLVTIEFSAARAELERVKLMYESTEASSLANERLRAERLREALLRYGVHDGQESDADKECRCVQDGPDTCDCGLDAALSAAKPAETKEEAPRG